MEPGFCKFCGTGKYVQTENKDDVDEIVTMECDCEDGLEYRLLKKTRARVISLCMSPKEETGMKPIAEDVTRSIADVSEIICFGHVDQIVVHAEGSTITITRKAEGIDVTRKKLMSAKATIIKK